jgi:amino acid transporter
MTPANGAETSGARAQSMRPVTPDAGGPERFGYRQDLKRSMGLADLLIYGLILISPIAPFGVFGFVYNASHGMAPLVYLLGLAAMLFTAFSYLAMSRAFPIAGSVYAYAGRGIGESAGFLAGWAILLDYLLVPTLIYVACAVAMSAVLPGVPKPVWIIGFLALNTSVNLLGIDTAKSANRILFGLQLLILAAFVAAALAALARGTAGAHVSIAPLWDPAKATPGLLFGALSMATLSFLGFDGISTLAEEARGGPGVVGTATVMSLVLAALLFVGQTYLASLFVLGRDAFPPGDATANAFIGIAAVVGGAPLRLAVAVGGLVLSGLAGAMAAQAATSRLLYSMARDGKLPRALAEVDAKRRTPRRAILLIAAVSLVLALALIDHLKLLVSLVSFGALFGFAMLHLSVVAHFLWRGRSRRWVAHLVAPGLGFAVVVYVLLNADPLAKTAGFLWLCLGAAVLVILKRRGRSARPPAPFP